MPPLKPGSARRQAADKPATVQVSLRLPESWMQALRQRALAATAREERIITPQEIMRGIIAAALQVNDREAGEDSPPGAGRPEKEP